MRILTFGEVMLRLTVPSWGRLADALPGTLQATFGGAEVNVAVSIASQGGQAAFCTVLPDNPLTIAFLKDLRRYQVDTTPIQIIPEGRLGIYFVEMGANQRPSQVTYDRQGSAISLKPPHASYWRQILTNYQHLHVSGITPALSAQAADSVMEGVKLARELGLGVSCDLNYRNKLWRWDPGTTPQALASRVMGELLKHVTILFANEEDAEKVLGLKAEGSNVQQGTLSLEGYVHVARQIVARYPQVQFVAMTLRQSFSASRNHWGALLYDGRRQESYHAPIDEHDHYRPYELDSIVDRIGAGDAFAGALLYALVSQGGSNPDQALGYAVAASCLKHSLPGDYNTFTRDEIERVWREGGSGRVQR